ncbi:MAG: hypothetical protein ACK5KP_10575 [Paludibacteraceae bacterium]
MNNHSIKIAHGLGGFLLLMGAAFQFFEFDFAKFIFAAGVIILIAVQAVYLLRVRHADIRTQRVMRIMFFITLLLGVGAYLMFIRDDRWVIVLLLYALVSVFLAFRSEKSKI